MHLISVLDIGCPGIPIIQCNELQSGKDTPGTSTIYTELGK